MCYEPLFLGSGLRQVENPFPYFILHVIAWHSETSSLPVDVLTL